MVLRLGDEAPDFTAESTEGTINCYDYLGDSWGVLFSHPKDFTPVCTTELGYMAKIKPEFDKRNVKILGLSVDPLDRATRAGPTTSRRRRAPRRTTRSSPTPTSTSQSCTTCCPPARPATRRKRTPADNMTVRNVFVDRSRQEDQAHPRLPDVDGPQLRRGAARHRLAAAHRELQRVDAGELEGRRRRDHRPGRSRTRTRRRSSRRAGRPSSRTSG